MTGGLVRVLEGRADRRTSSCDVYWPGFRKVDFLRALRSYAARHRRFGAWSFTTVTGG
jgi:hypothetical protein